MSGLASGDKRHAAEMARTLWVKRRTAEMPHSEHRFKAAGDAALVGWEGGAHGGSCGRLETECLIEMVSAVAAASRAYHSIEAVLARDVKEREAATKPAESA